MPQEFWKKRPEMLELLMERRSTRKYTEEMISDDDLKKILMAVMLSFGMAETMTFPSTNLTLQ